MESFPIETLKTSNTWQELHPMPKIYDPDGWDRTNFQYSLYEEPITFEEYEQRRMNSTCLYNMEDK